MSCCYVTGGRAQKQKGEDPDGEDARSLLAVHEPSERDGVEVCTKLQRALPANDSVKSTIRQLPVVGKLFFQLASFG